MIGAILHPGRVKSKLQIPWIIQFSRKKSLDSPGIEPAISRSTDRRLNHSAIPTDTAKCQIVGYL